jgi:hypothetical protein
MSPAASQNKLVLAIDLSELMPFDTAQPALAAFLNLLQLGDQFAVLGYRGRISRIYPRLGLATYDDRQVLTDASEALIAASTSGTASSMSAVLNAGKQALAGKKGPKAMLLVAASPWNRGTDPLLDLPAFRVETIAIGDNGQQETLRAIAADTGGTYSSALATKELMPILLDVVERLGIAQILAVGSRTVANHQSYSLVGRLPAATAVGTFLVFWGDPAITYGTGSGPRWVTVELLDPDGKPTPAEPAWAGDGFALFAVAQPAAGSWTLASTFVGPGSCSFTNAVLA